MDKNSAIIWFNAIKEHLPVPKTIMIEYDHVEFICALECDPSVDKEKIASTIKEAESACNEIGYPCFIRSDLTSAKHSGPSHYLATSEKNVSKILFSTAEDNELKLWPYSRPTHFMIREFLDLNYSFTAFDDFPVAREFRLFADSEEVKCMHPYWPEDTIRFNKGKEVEGWKEGLKKHHEMPAEIADIKAMAIQAVKLISQGEWSVDFAQDKSGKWWLIDMATAESSYHWEGCQNEL